MIDYPINLKNDVPQEIWQAIMYFARNNYGLKPQAVIIHPLTYYKLVQAVAEVYGSQCVADPYPPTFRGVRILRSADVEEHIVTAIFPNPE